MKLVFHFTRWLAQNLLKYWLVLVQLGSEIYLSVLRYNRNFVILFNTKLLDVICKSVFLEVTLTIQILRLYILLIYGLPLLNMFNTVYCVVVNIYKNELHNNC